jgi:hypothetical protein
LVCIKNSLSGINSCQIVENSIIGIPAKLLIYH